MTVSLRFQLVTGLANIMAGMTHSEAKQFAHELTEEVSAVVAGLRTTNWNLPCFPKETWNRRQAGRSVADALIHTYVEKQGHGYPSSEQPIPMIWAQAATGCLRHR